MADENRVFDVAKPGSSKPETGSKPMVVGHKMMKDPTLKEAEEVTIEEPQKIQQTISKTIKPLDKELTSEPESKNTDEKSDEANTVSNDEKIEKQDPVTEEKAEAKEVKNEDQSSNQSDQNSEQAEDTTEQKELSVQENAVEQEENLQKIIKEKTYNVHIEEASAHAFKTFLKTFVIVAIVGLLVLVVLIDAEVIDLGVTLPFDFL